jgi:hypothetical protein
MTYFYIFHNTFLYRLFSFREGGGGCGSLPLDNNNTVQNSRYIVYPYKNHMIETVDVYLQLQDCFSFAPVISSVGQNGKSLEAEFLDEILSFPPCYSQSPLQLCLEISISSNSRNLLQFLQFSYCALYRRKEENLTVNHTPLPNGLRNPHRNLKSENSQVFDKILPRSLNEIVRS